MKWVRGLLVAAVSCGTVAVGTWIFHAASGAAIDDPTSTLATLATALAVLLAAGAGAIALSRPWKS